MRQGFSSGLRGVAVGYLLPDFGKALKPLGDGFIKLVKMMIAPIIFCTVVHGIAWYSGFSIFRFLGYVKEELLLVLGTSSSETALPGLIEKMERRGCTESTVGLVVATVVISRWEKELTAETLNANLRQPIQFEMREPVESGP